MWGCLTELLYTPKLVTFKRVSVVNYWPKELDFAIALCSFLVAAEAQRCSLFANSLLIANAVCTWGAFVVLIFVPISASALPVIKAYVCVVAAKCSHSGLCKGLQNVNKHQPWGFFYKKEGNQIQTGSKEWWEMKRAGFTLQSYSYLS